MTEKPYRKLFFFLFFALYRICIKEVLTYAKTVRSSLIY